MQIVEVMAVGGVVVVGLLGLMGLVLIAYMAVLLLKAARRRGKQLPLEQETRMIQEMYRDMGSLATRLESLEAILMATAPKTEDGGRR